MQYGKALKKLMAVDKHFADIMEDQFDFHSYCLRKMTLRAYVRMLRCESSRRVALHSFTAHLSHAAWKIGCMGTTTL
jgi:hypothetical protein